MKKFLSFVFLGLTIGSVLAQTKPSAAKAQHIGVQMSTDGVRLLFKSALDLMNGGAEDSTIVIPKGNYYQKLTYENPKFDKMFGIVNELFGVDVKLGLPLNIYYGKGSVVGKVNPEDFKFSAKKLSSSKFQIDVSVNVSELKATIPSLKFCTEKNCKGGNFVKFKDLVAGLALNSSPIIVNASMEVSFSNVTKTVDGKTVTSKIAQIKVLSTTSNLNTKGGPQVYLSYFKGAADGVTWPNISAIQIGPSGFGLNINSNDLIREIDLYKNDLGKMIIKKGAEFVTNDMATFLNKVLKDKKFTPEYWGTYSNLPVDRTIEKNDDDEDEFGKYSPLYDIKPMERDNTYVAPIVPIPQEDLIDDWTYFNTLIKSIKYGVMLSDVNIKNTAISQLFNLLIDTDITVNNENLKPISTKGHGNCYSSSIPFSTVSLNCLQPLKPIYFENSNLNNNMAVAFSESYLNSLLMLAHKQGILQKMMNKMAPMQGVYLGADGIKVHFTKPPGAKKSYAYIILNLIIKLDEQPSWIDRNIGDWIEDTWGETNGVIKLVLEIPADIWLQQKNGKHMLMVRAGSPFLNADVTNHHKYPSNLNMTARTWLVDIKPKIINKVRDAFNELYESPFQIWDEDLRHDSKIQIIKEKAAVAAKKDILGRVPMKLQEIDLSEYLKSIPVDFKPTGFALESTGHAALYGKMNKIDTTKISVGN